MTLKEDLTSHPVPLPQAAIFMLYRLHEQSIPPSLHGSVIRKYRHCYNDPI